MPGVNQANQPETSKPLAPGFCHSPDGEHAALADIADALSADCLLRQGHSAYERCGVHWPELPGLLL